MKPKAGGTKENMAGLPAWTTWTPNGHFYWICPYVVLENIHSKRRLYPPESTEFPASNNDYYVPAMCTTASMQFTTRCANGMSKNFSKISGNMKQKYSGPCYGSQRLTLEWRQTD